LATFDYYIGLFKENINLEDLWGDIPNNVRIFQSLPMSQLHVYCQLGCVQMKPSWVPGIIHVALKSSLAKLTR
jgi:hypothetical protein